MVGPKYTYRMRFRGWDGGWFDALGTVGLEFGRGQLAEYRQRPGPTLACQLVRSDGKVMDETPERREVSAGLMPQAFGHQWPMLAAAGARSIRRAADDARQAHRPGVREALEKLADHVETELARLNDNRPGSSTPNPDVPR